MDIENSEYCFVTWVTHNSRISQRMEQFLPSNYIKKLSPVILNMEDQLLIAKLIAESCSLYKLSTITFNILPDHVHGLFRVESEEELILKIGRIKGYTAHTFRKEKKLKSRLWARKFNRDWIVDDDHLNSVINYIDLNHLKHEKSWGREFLCGFHSELRNIVRSVSTPII